MTSYSSIFRPFFALAGFLTGLGISPEVHAKVVIKSVSGYSNIIMGSAITGGAEDNSSDSVGNVFSIFGGMAGDGSRCSGLEPTQPCNSCGGPAIESCNFKRIYPGLQLAIEFTSTVNGTPRLVTSNTDSAAEVVPMERSGTNGSYFLRFQWSALCAALPSGDSSCNLSKNATFYIGVGASNETTLDPEARLAVKIFVQSVDVEKTFHTNCAALDSEEHARPDEAICEFAMYPGDGKAYIEYLRGEPVLVGDNGVEYDGVQIFYNTAGFESVTTASESEFVRIEETADNEFIPETDIVAGLQNGTTYYFRLGNVDQAGNIYYFSRHKDEQKGTPSVGTRELETVNTLGAKHSVTPDVVFGVLDDEHSCFIATAAYGSPFQSKVADLRNFRNRYLNSNPIGQAFVSLYYTYSPPFAQWISKSDFRRQVVRVGLWPVWAISKSLLWLEQQLFPRAHGQDAPPPPALDPFGSQDDIELELQDAEDIFSTTEEDFPLPVDDLNNIDDQEEVGTFEPIPLAPDLEESDEPVVSAPRVPVPPVGPSERRIRHPGAAKGLVRIDKEGVYHYKTEQSPQSSAASVKFGGMQAPNILSHGNTVDFTDVYGSGPLTSIWFDYEWPWTTSIGKLGLKASTGVIFATGNGVFESDRSRKARETYTFFVIPTIASASYRFQLSPSPIFVPYVEGGGGSFNIIEHRDDGKDTKFAYSPIATGSGGVLISLTRWSKESAFTLDSEYGINNVWLDVALRSIVGFGDIDFTSTMVHAGITLDY